MKGNRSRSRAASRSAIRRARGAVASSQTALYEWAAA